MYYRLTYQDTWQGHKAGDGIMCSKRQLDIGQTEECNVVLPESDDYEPMLFATILPLEDSGWCIVRRTDCYSISVNDTPLLSTVRLHDGDSLCFSGFGHSIRMQFNVHTDSDYDDAAGVVLYHNQRGRLYPISILLAVAALAVACYAIWGKHNNDGIRSTSLDKYEASVYHIVTDEVVLVKDTMLGGVTDEIVVERVVLSPPLSATCFLTDDGRFVTARHCIEPWVADESWDGVSEMTMPADVRLAVIAETANQNGDGQWNVRSHCTISRDGESHEFWSNEFHINRSRDMVMQLGSQETPLWLRTIIPVATRRNMELGDMAYVCTSGLKGELEMANVGDLEQFDHQSNRDVAILGFPQKEGNNDMLTLTYGNSQRIRSVSSSMQGCIQMSALINKGNSGGPVLALIGSRIKVVGLVSKVDLIASQGTFWAVPATEMVHDTNDGITFPTNIYRR